MAIKVRVNINPSGLLANNNRFEAAQKWLDNEVIKDCNPYVPYRTGDLATSVIRHTVIGSGMIVYKTPYAKVVYNSDGWHFSANIHELATDHWLDVVKPLQLKKWQNGVMRILGER